MAYSGTTAATTLRNPMRLTAGGGLYSPSNGASTVSSGLSTASETPNAQGAKVWSVCSTNLTTDWMGGTIGDITDGYELGMRPGDVVMATQFTSHGSTIVLSFHVVASVNSTAGTAILSTAANSVLTSTYN